MTTNMPELPTLPQQCAWTYASCFGSSKEFALYVPLPYRPNSWSELTSVLRYRAYLTRRNRQIHASISICYLRSEISLFTVVQKKEAAALSAAHEEIRNRYAEHVKLISEKAFKQAKWAAAYKINRQIPHDRISQVQPHDCTPVASVLDDCYMVECPLPSGAYIFLTEDGTIHSFQSTGGCLSGQGLSTFWRHFAEFQNWTHDRKARRFAA